MCKKNGCNCKCYQDGFICNTCNKYDDLRKGHPSFSMSAGKGTDFQEGDDTTR
ncbi:MAG: hypothetical protein OEL81_04250 [Nitrosopumilus sp.]|nr:hypothetical protein [Nitrosopumilus sp.]